LLGRYELVNDARFATVAARHANHDAIDEIIRSWTATVNKMEAMERLQAAGIPAGAVLDGRDMHFDPQFKARGLLENIEFPLERKMGAKYRPVVGRPWRFSATSPAVRGPAPMFGQHNRHVLVDILGYDEARYQALESAGIIAGRPVKPREAPDMKLEDRVRLGRLAYWDRDYKARLGLE
jgi:crotonobetainyl-CoA:carnitine CoA-transferase CaiB-like acyl-CoA transferase